MGGSRRDDRSAGRVLPAMVLGAAAMLPLAAHAEISNDPMLGLGLRSRPAYDGSPTQRLQAVPVLRFLGTPGFARSTQGVLEAGLRIELAPGLHAGVQLAYEPGRQAGDSDFLAAHHVADVRRGASAGVQAEWDFALGPMPLALLARARRHTDSDRGGQADLRLSAGVFQQGPLGVGVFTQATWADAASSRTDYGVSLQASAATGLPAFRPSGGLLHASAGVLWSIKLSPTWVAVGNLEARRLQGDAARSPLVERRSAGYATAGLARTF